MTLFVPILLALLVAAALVALLVLTLGRKKRPRPKVWVAIMAAVVCAVVALLLLADPAQRGDQIQGVSIRQGYVVDGGVSVSLPQDLQDDLVHLLAQVKIGSYTAVDTYTPPEGAVVLADGNDGTEFILSPDDPATLTRINHDGYTSLRKQTTLSQDFISDPALAAFWADVDTYLTTGRAEALYALKTPYVGDHIAVGQVLGVLGIADAVGNYTLSLQTSQEPYGITLNFQASPTTAQRTQADAYLQQIGSLFLSLVDNASSFSWTYPDGTSGGSVTLTQAEKPSSLADFQALYTSWRNDPISSATLIPES